MPDDLDLADDLSLARDYYPEPLLLRSQHVEPAPVDRRPTSPVFHAVPDRRGQEILVADEKNRVSAIVPGGVRLVDQVDDRDLPLLWRVAHWPGGQALVDDLPPAFVYDTNLQELVRRCPAHAEWMLKRSAKQLANVSLFLERSASMTDAGRRLAYRRTLYVYLELDGAATRYERRIGRVPPETRDVLGVAGNLLRQAEPLAECIVALSGRDELVMLRRGIRRWRGSAARLRIVLIKLEEAQRILDDGGTKQQALHRLRYLRGALDVADSMTAGRALEPLRRRCEIGIAVINADQWSDVNAGWLRQALRAEAAQLRNGLRLRPARHGNGWRSVRWRRLRELAAPSRGIDAASGA